MKYISRILLTVFLLTLIALPQFDAHAIPTYEDACLSPYLGAALTVGNQNQDVLDLQNFLVERGFLAQGVQSGYFGPLTRQAVREFQATNGIVSSGTAATTGYGAIGPRTRAVINEIVCNGVIAGNPIGANPQNPNLNPGAPGMSPVTPTNFTMSIKAGGSTVPASIVAGAPIVIEWGILPANTPISSCTGSGAGSSGGTGIDASVWNGGKGSSGLMTARPLTDTTYTISCTSSDRSQTQTANVTVRVIGSPSESSNFTMSIKAGGSTTPSPITAGSPIAIEWGILPLNTSISSCTGSGSGVGATGIDAAVWNGGKGSSGLMTARPLADTTYIISCTSSDRTRTQTASVTVRVTGSGTQSGTEPKITKFDAIPGRVTSVGVSQEFTFVWTSENSRYCYGQDGTSSQWLNQWPTSGTTTLNIFVDGEFTLKCTTGVGGLYAPTAVDKEQVMVNRSTPNGPVVTFTATPSSIAVNGSAKIEWSAPSATVCRGGGDNSFALYVNSVTGNKDLTFIYPGTWNISITCNSANGGSTTRTISVVVGGTGTQTPPTGIPAGPSAANPSGIGVDIEANGSDGPVTISAGQSATLRWGTVPNALIFRMVCRASGGNSNSTQGDSVNWSGYRLPVDSFIARPTQTTTYTISCQDNASGYTATDSVTVNVTAANTAPTVSFTSSAYSVPSGGSAMLTWNAINASVCLVSGGGLNVTNNSVQGMVSTGPLTVPTTYSISCYKNVPNSNNYLVPVYAPTQTMTINIASPAQDSEGNGGSGGTVQTGSGAVTLDLRANNQKGSVTTTANAGAVAISWSMSSSNSTALIGWTCNVSGVPGISSVAPSGQTLFVRPSTSTSYGISCTSFLTNQTISDSVMVNVQ